MAYPDFPLLAVSVLTLIAQYAAAIILLRNKRDVASWLMMLGTVSSFLAGILPWLGIIRAFSFQELPVSVVSWAYGLGGLLFFIGLTLHALKISRIKERVVELEAIATAQAIELERLRNS